MNTEGMSQRDVERTGVEWSMQLLKRWAAPTHPIIDTNLMKQNVLRQRTLGDLLVTETGGTTGSVEVKTERRHTGNLFIEVWSNQTEDNEWRRDGWIFTLKADAIIFVFLDVEVIYLMPFVELQRWCWIEKGMMYNFPQRPAGLSKEGRQRNNTIGHLVPIEAVRKEALVSEFRRVDGSWRKQCHSSAGAT